MKVNRSFQFTGLCLYERGNVKYGFIPFLSWGHTTLNENIIEKILEIDSSQYMCIHSVLDTYLYYTAIFTPCGSPSFDIQHVSRIYYS